MLRTGVSAHGSPTSCPEGVKGPPKLIRILAAGKSAVYSVPSRFFCPLSKLCDFSSGWALLDQRGWAPRCISVSISLAGANGTSSTPGAPVEEKPLLVQQTLA